MIPPSLRCIVPVALLLTGAIARSESAQLAREIPWNVVKLSRTPGFEWHDAASPVRSLLYAGEPYKGKSTRVFAYYSSPLTLGIESDKAKKFPGVVLVHGGGGTAFAKWAEIYARRGYAAIAMDLGGKWLPEPSDKPEKAAVPLSDGGPAADDTTKFSPTEPPHRDQWTYHAVRTCCSRTRSSGAFPKLINHASASPESVGVAISLVSWRESIPGFGSRCRNMAADSCAITVPGKRAGLSRRNSARRGPIAGFSFGIHRTTWAWPRCRFSS